MILQFITDFADQAVILPVGATVALVLCLQARWRVASAWVVAVGGVLGLIGTLKLLDYACGWLWPVLGAARWAIQSPSGHTSAAAVVFGALAGLGFRHAGWRLPVAASVAAGSGIGLTRLLLHAHSPAEIVIGLLAGVGGTYAFAVLAGPGLGERSGLPAVLAATAVLLLLHGRQLPAEAAIGGQGAALMRSLITACRPGGRS